MRRYILGGTLLALVAVLVRVAHGQPGLSWWYACAWALFPAALWLARGLTGRRAGAWVVAGGIAVAATGLAAPPSTSTDSYRYAWDGRVQAAGFSPYDHAPADPALAALRDPWLFPEDGGTLINRPAVHTIYPPLAEVYFLLVHVVSPDGVRHKALQLAGALLSVAVLPALRRRWGDRAAACWAWCPAVPVEAVNNAHVDVLGVLLVVLAFSVTRGRGALLGAAVAVKLLPVLALPGALAGALRAGIDRRRIAAIAAIAVPAALVVVLAYLPYVLGSRASVLGYLFGYLQEEGYEDPGARGRYGLLRLVVPDAWAPVAVALVMAAVVAYVLRRGSPERPWEGALLTTGSLMLLLTPGYSWYALLVVALAAMAGRPEWLGVAAAGAVAYLGGPATAAYALAAGLVVLTACERRRRRSPAAAVPSLPSAG
ncbi:glycosyltransferase 87 family protein [Streptosporangium sp. NPDC023615]|uniref:glycosyltransferase 87 family protein n=1 Tax=Streptosporangium sp. NPDC023615 TaxID=3154794 RepID=UPI00343EBC05